MSFLSSVKGFARTNFPSAFRRAQRVKDRVRDELALLRRLGFRGAMRLLRSRQEVQDASDSAQALRHLVLDAGAARVDLEAWLTARECGFARGAHAVYIAPGEVAAHLPAGLLAGYPAGAGLKVLRATAATGGRYVHGQNMAALQDAVAYDAPALATLSNALAHRGVAPRVWDVCLVRVGADEHFAFVLEDIPEPVRRPEQFAAGRAQVDAMLASGDFALVDPYGYGGLDFSPPDGNGNFRVRADGSVVYVDTQNFVFADYQAYLSRRAQDWVDPSHFGGQSVFRGGKYLYQSVPGLRHPGKRDTRAREGRYRVLLAEANVSLRDRVVFDIGGNIGRMSAFALHEGARWIHLWDMPATAKAAEEALLLTGYTRCSTTGGPLTPDRDLPADLPEHLRGIPARDGVVFYLAIHHHVAWLHRLPSLPWKHLVFEGPEGQTPAQLDAVIAALHAMTPVRVLARTVGADGDSETRPACIIERIA